MVTDVWKDYFLENKCITKKDIVPIEIDVGYKVISDYIMSLQYKNEDQEYTHTNEQVGDKVYPILLGRFVHEYQKYAIQAGTNIYTNIIVWSELDYCNMYQGLPSPWKDGEKRECRFVFIGRDLDHKALEAGFLDCKAEPLRFKVGDTVYANVGEFTEGKIVKCWDDGNPYRVELQNEDKTNVWVPIDNDDYCRDSKP